MLIAILVIGYKYYDNLTEEGKEHEESGEHKEGGENGEGEESDNQYSLEEIYDETRNGTRLIISYDSQNKSFNGTVENTSDNILKTVRVKVNLSNGVELGSTTPVNVKPGKKMSVNLKTNSTNFVWWTAHPEVTSCEPYIKSDKIETINNITIDDLEIVDRKWFISIKYNSSNNDLRHKLTVSHNENLTKPVYIDWIIGTENYPYHKNVEFNIPSKVIIPNSTIYYQIEQINPSDPTTQYKTKIYSVSNQINHSTPILKQLVKSGEDYGRDYPWNWCHEVIWDPITNQFWSLTSGEMDFEKKAWTSKTPFNWEYKGIISEDYPYGWTSHKGVSGYILDNGTYVASINIQDDNGTGAALYIGDSFVDMELKGILFKYSENEYTSRNCRLNDFWYNMTDESWYGYVSGSKVWKGTRTHVYLVHSYDLNFTGNFDEYPLYYNGQWGKNAWPKAGIYPPNIIWMDGSGFAGVKGYRNRHQPYDFDADLIFVDSPRGFSTNSFYSKRKSPEAYFNEYLGFNDTQRSVPVIQDGVVWFFIRSGVQYGAFGNVLSLTGFWVNETVRISPGYNPLYHYTSLPTKDEYDSMLDITLYTINDEANVTVTQYDKDGPIYLRLWVEGEKGDSVIVHIEDLVDDMVYLHVDANGDSNQIILSDSTIGAIKKLTPKDNSFLFSFKID
jgi:hypothetical protein